MQRGRSKPTGSNDGNKGVSIMLWWRDRRQPIHGAAGMNLTHRALDVRHFGFPCWLCRVGWAERCRVRARTLRRARIYMMNRTFDIDAQLREHEVFRICATYCPQPLFKVFSRKLWNSWQKLPHLFGSDAATTNTVHDSGAQHSQASELIT